MRAATADCYPREKKVFCIVIHPSSFIQQHPIALDFRSRSLNEVNSGIVKDEVNKTWGGKGEGKFGNFAQSFRNEN